MATLRLPDIPKAIGDWGINILKSADQKLRKYLDDSHQTFLINEQKKREEKQKNIKLLSPRSSEAEYLEQEKLKTSPTTTPITRLPEIKGATTSLPDISNQPDPTITPVPTTSPIGVGTTIGGFMRQPTGKPFYDIIVNTAQQRNINPALAAAGLMNESGLDPNTPDSVNYKDGIEISRDIGIAQINNIAHPEVTEAQARDPAFAIPWKINKIADNIEKYSDINHAIAAYNLGDAGLARRLGPGYRHYASGLDAYGQNYINKFVKNLDPKLVEELGFKPSPPEEEAEIIRLIRLEQSRKKK